MKNRKTTTNKNKQACKIIDEEEPSVCVDGVIYTASEEQAYDVLIDKRGEEDEQILND